MKKKIVVALLLLAMIPCMAFASVFQFGPTFSYNLPVDLEAEEAVDFENFDFSDFTVGADLRFNILPFLQLQSEARGGFDKELKLKQMDAYVAANLRFNMLIADLTVGGGLRSQITIEEGVWAFDGQPFSDFNTFLNGTSLYYRAGFNINLGRISLATEGILPTNLTVAGMSEEKNQSVLDALTPDLQQTKVSVGLLVNIF